MMMHVRPRVGISRCLLGDEVRYDGSHRRDETVIALLGPHVEWIAVCPEVEIGMGTPRQPIQLVARPDGVPSKGTRVRLVGVVNGEDWTDRMQTWARDRVHELARLNLSGYVFKARSPSCGIDDVAVDGLTAEHTGRGLFAQALIDAWLGLPVTDEAALADPANRSSFLNRVLQHQADSLSR